MNSLKEADVKQNFARELDNELQQQQLPGKGDTKKSFLFTVVRDPWRRLVSTYIEKFIYTKEYMFQCSVKSDWGKFDE